MRHFKHYCKLIISTIAVVLVFACHSLVSYADPLTGAMIGSMVGSEWSFAGFGAMLPGAAGETLGGFFQDLVPWDTLVQAGQAYITIRNLIGSNNVEVQLSPELAEAGANRTSQFAQHYNLQPGQIKSFGNVFSLGNYAFTTKNGNTDIYYGPSLGNLTYDSTNPFNVLPYASFTIQSPITSSSNGTFTIEYPNASFPNQTLNRAWVNRPVVLGISVSNGQPALVTYGRLDSGSFNTIRSWTTLSTAGFSVLTSSPSVTADSIVDPDGRANAIVLPSSALQDISYNDGDTITNEEILKLILDIITEYGLAGEIPSSGYVEPVDPPVPPTSETIAETEYSILNETFDEFKEIFGDIYGDIVEFKESFGDWVNDVASGWTEVFGDIYDDLHEFRESFGDWVDDVATGWTEVFGDIYSTLQGIAGTISGTISSTLQAILTGVQSIVQSIENAQFEFVDAFWKNFLTPFNNFFLTIKSHLSIWHYVVEWLASISSVFTFYLGVFSGAGSQFLLPIYACFAGTVVIAVYRRFGK